MGTALTVTHIGHSQTSGSVQLPLGGVLCLAGIVGPHTPSILCHWLGTAWKGIASNGAAGTGMLPRDLSGDYSLSSWM